MSKILAFGMGGLLLLGACAAPGAPVRVPRSRASLPPPVVRSASYRLPVRSVAAARTVTPAFVAPRVVETRRLAAPEPAVVRAPGPPRPASMEILARPGTSSIARRALSSPTPVVPVSRPAPLRLSVASPLPARAAPAPRAPRSLGAARTSSLSELRGLFESPRASPVAAPSPCAADPCAGGRCLVP